MNTVKKLLKKILPNFLIDCYHRFLPMLGAFLYGFPSKKLKVIGITGTNGKSTTVMMASKILEEAGLKIASLSSIKFKIGNREWPNTLKMTMPGRLKLQRFLKQAVKAACQYAVLEVTSEGIKQHRHRFIDFDIAVLTNLTPEHIEAHGGFEKYRRAKGQLFKKLKAKSEKLKTKAKNLKLKKTSIVNLDDENAEYFLQFEADRKYCYSTQDSLNSSKTFILQSMKVKEAEVLVAQQIKIGIGGVYFRIKNQNFNLKLLGKFNVQNALAAICVGLAQGIDLETIKTALEKIKGVPGRMETVIKEPFRVVVDYAHTPDALQKVYATLSNYKLQTTNYKLICVLGSCGGGRDKWKRPELGKIAAKFCQEIILTDEDPYDEPPSKILEEIAAGIETNNLQPTTYKLILDRREAIRRALSLAGPCDVVIITGKGSEPWMCIEGGKKIPWDDRKIVKEELQKLSC